MAEKTNRQPEERTQTDESLRIERQKTDVELAGAVGSIKENAAAVVAGAREKADRVLRQARSVEDRRQGPDEESHEPGAAVDAARAREDAAIAAQREGADERADQEGSRRDRALRNLLALERQDTDVRLETERAASDVALHSREDFLAMVSHDLRTLLGGIAISADTILRRDPRGEANPAIPRNVEAIQRFTARMNRLIGDLLDVTSLDAGQLSIIRKRSDARHVVRESLEAFTALAAKKHLALSSSLSPGELAAEFDEERILQVLANLVGNAIKFTPAGGRIVVRVERRADELRFAVEDSGEGVPPDRLEQIFLRFFQAHGTDRRGLGLGLYIARSIVDAHGGKLWAESTPGTGSTFFFTLPLHARLSEASSPPPA